MKEFFVIINPMSRGGKNKRFLKKVKGWFRENIPHSVIKETVYAGHATDLARRAAEDGYQKCISIGGDGTLNEVINGVVQVPTHKRPAIGLISTGTGGDFIRSIKEKHPIPKGVAWLSRTREIPVDIGLALLDREGMPPLNKYFVNIADVGIAGEVIRRVNATSKRLGVLEYLWSTIVSAFSFKPPRVKIQGFVPEGKGNLNREMGIMILVVANGKYFGGGMCIAPDAKVDDGYFQVMLGEEMPYYTLLGQIHCLYRHKRLSHPKIYYGNEKKLVIESVQDILPVDIDGEFYQTRKIQFEICPSAIKLLVPREN